MSVLAAKSSRQRLWLLGGAFVAFLLVLIGYVALIGPQRSQTASVDAQVQNTRTANSVLQSRITALQAQNQKLSTYRSQAMAAMAALPTESGMPSFLRTLQTLGTRTHTDAVSVTVGTPTDVTSVADGTAPASTATAAGTTTTTAAATPVAGAPAAGTGVYALPITAQVNGSPTALGQFLQQLQQVQPRAVLITQIVQGTASGATGSVANTVGSTLQLTMQAFMAPGMAAQLASASGH